MNKPNNQFSAEEFKTLKGKKVKVSYNSFWGEITSQEGIVKIKDGWIYIYDEGKSGIEFNAAFKIRDEIVNDVINIVTLN